MRVLILMHDPREDAGSIYDFLKEGGPEVSILRLYEGDALPSDISGVEAVVSMGGPMNVYEEVVYPFLKEETVFLARCFERKVPVLGICLGAQMMAKAAGARVTRAPKEEIGWYEVTLTEVGRNDPYFKGLPDPLTVFQLHGDTFEIPSEGTLLATAPTCRNQAFRIANSLALQFHLEINNEKLSVWLADHHLKGEVLRRYEGVRESLDRHARRLYENFFRR